MTLTKNCRYVLDQLIAHPPERTSDKYNMILWANCIDETRMDFATYAGVLETLADGNLIDWVDHKHGDFILKESGRNYKEIRGIERRVSWRNRLIGFVAGIASSVIIELVIQFIRRKIGA